MNKLNFTSKSNGDVLDASEWNAVVSKTDELVQAINDGAGSGSGSSSTPVAIDTNGVVSVNSKGNTTISATKHINLEPAYVANGGSGTYGDVQIKPGDDITLESHHRAEDKRDEITVKTSNGQDGNAKAPVKLQVIASDVTLSTKGKKVESGSNDSANVMNIRVTDGKGKGYLKVRAQAIDLRSESHGGIALQPKGTDGQGHMNKIKFEHGGGDGLEFGTFNTEKTSIFTDEYRFNKDGVWKMATRVTEASDKADENDSTTALKYVKQADDFYDVITPYDQANDTGDEQCTTKDIIKTAYAMNGTPCVHTKVTKKGALEISTSDQYLVSREEPAGFSGSPISVEKGSGMLLMPTDGKYYSRSEWEAFFDDSSTSTMLAAMDAAEDGDWIAVSISDGVKAAIYYLKKFACPDIKIDSGAQLKLGGILDFGSTFAFGETDGGVEFQLKKTKKDAGAEKDCGILKVTALNNHATNNYVVDGFVADNTNHTYQTQQVTLQPGTTHTVGSCSVLDIIKFVAWAKATQFGPWGTSITSTNGITVNNLGVKVDQGGGAEISDEPAPANP